MVKYNEQIKDLEDELKKTKYNKATQHHIGLVKAKIAKLRDKQESRGKGGKKGEGYTVRKTGDATVILVGFPSVGKSTLLNQLTNAKSDVASYAFTTLTCIPGLLEHKFAKIQVLDVPGVVRGAASGRGRGKEVLAVIQNADLVLVLVDINNPAQQKILMKEIYDSHVRLNQKLPDVKIRKTLKGGVKVGATVKLKKIETKTIKAVLNEFRLVNADVTVREDIDADQLIDLIEKNKIYVPGLTVVNKVDLASEEQIKKVKKKLKPDIMISAEKNVHIDKLKDLIFDKLKFIRIFLKEPRKEADVVEPLIMFKGCTIQDVCLKLHRDFADRFRFARMWGKSVKFDGQKILKKKHVILDKDILELHID